MTDNANTQLILARIDGFEKRVDARAAEVDRRLEVIDKNAEKAAKRMEPIEDFVTKCSLGRRWLIRGLYIVGSIIMFFLVLWEKLVAVFGRVFQ